MCSARKCRTTLCECVCKGWKEEESEMGEGDGFFVSFFFRPQTTNQQTCCSSLAELVQCVRVLSSVAGRRRSRQPQQRREKTRFLLQALFCSESLKVYAGKSAEIRRVLRRRKTRRKNGTEMIRKTASVTSRDGGQVSADCEIKICSKETKRRV